MSGVLLGAAAIEHRRQVGAAAEPALVVTTKRVFMCTAGTCGLCICAISEMPEAQKRGIVGGARNLRAEFGREFAVHGRAMHADLLEQPAVHHRHHAAAARLAGMVGAVPGRAHEAAGVAGIERRAVRRPRAVRSRRRCRRAAPRTSLSRAPCDPRSTDDVHVEQPNLPRAVIGAAFVAAVAMDADARDLPACCSRSQMKRDRFSSVGAPSASILLSNLWSSVFCTSAMRALEQAEVEHHAGRGIGRAAHGDLGAERMAVDFLAGLAERRAGQRMRRLEAERFRQFPHRKSDAEVLSDTECLVRLQAEPPLRMAQAIVDRARGVLDHVRAVHRLQRKALEGEARKMSPARRRPADRPASARGRCARRARRRPSG